MQSQAPGDWKPIQADRARFLSSLFGKPQINVPDEYFVDPFIGMKYELRDDTTGQVFLYILKSIENGWWKLEWPD